MLRNNRMSVTLVQVDLGWWESPSFVSPPGKDSRAMDVRPVLCRWMLSVIQVPVNLGDVCLLFDVREHFMMIRRSDCIWFSFFLVLKTQRSWSFCPLWPSRTNESSLVSSLLRIDLLVLTPALLVIFVDRGWEPADRSSVLLLELLELGRTRPPLCSADWVWGWVWIWSSCAESLSSSRCYRCVCTAAFLALSSGMFSFGWVCCWRTATSGCPRFSLCQWEQRLLVRFPSRSLG